MIVQARGDEDLCRDAVCVSGEKKPYPRDVVKIEITKFDKRLDVCGE